MYICTVVPEADAKQLVAAPIRSKWKVVNIKSILIESVDFSNMRALIFLSVNILEKIQALPFKSVYAFKFKAKVN